MAEKEERILVLTTHNEDGECECVTQEGCHANDSCAICNVGMTRQEAIECMARALHKYEFTYSPVPMPTWCELNDDVKNDYRKMAEAELNALLNN